MVDELVKKSQIQDQEQRLLCEYTESIRDALFKSGIPTDAIMSHLDGQFIKFDNKIREGDYVKC